MKKRVSVPTCRPDLVGLATVRSEAAVILGPGSEKGSKQLMAVRDGAVFEVPQSVIDHSDVEKARKQFARKYSRWGTHYCSCKVCVRIMHYN